MKKKTVKTPFGKYEVDVVIGKYNTWGNTAVELIEDGMPFATITVNLCDLPENLACIDTNNCPWAEDFIKEYDLGKNTGVVIPSGFCKYPVYELNLESDKF